MVDENSQTGKSVRVSERTYERLDRMKEKDETFDVLIARVIDQIEEYQPRLEATSSIDRLMEIGYFPFGDAHKMFLQSLFSEALKLGNDVRCATRIDKSLYSNISPGKKNSFIFYKHCLPMFKISTVEGGFHFYKLIQKTEMDAPEWVKLIDAFESESETARNYILERIQKEINVIYRDAKI